MKWLDRYLYAGDFMPIFIGIVILLFSSPPIFFLFWYPDQNSDAIRIPLLVLFAGGICLGLSSVVVGIRLCARPGTFWYRVVYGRIFRH
jgi:hypothetical protein